MATNSGNIAIGKATVSIGPYVTAGGAGSLVDVGHTKGPTTLEVAFTDYEIITEQSFGAIKKVPISAAVKLKVLMDEATMTNVMTAFRQAAANLSGTAPNQTGLVGNITELYKQIQIVTNGTGSTTTAVRTITLWKCIVESCAAVQFGKQPEQTYEVTFSVLYDDSVATGDKFFKLVDSGGS